MMRALILAAALLAGSGAVLHAGQYAEFPAPSLYPFQRSVRTGAWVAIPPYRRPFVVRVYSTPPQQPYYNVPPYPVIAPY